MKQSVRYLRFRQLVTSVASHRLIGRLALFGMALPDFRIGRVASPAGLSRGLLSYPRVLGARGHPGWLATDDPEDSEQRDNANSDRQKIKVFPIHKAGRAL